MRIGFFEDSAATNLAPISLMRPVFELVCGHFGLRERLVRALPVTDWGVLIRCYLANTYAESHPEARINDTVWLREAPTLLVNGRWLPDTDTIRRLVDSNDDEAGIIDGTLAYLTLDPLEASLLSDEAWDDALLQIMTSRHQVEATGVLIDRPWDLINHNGEQVISDFRLRKFGPSQTPKGPHVPLGPNLVFGPQGALGSQVAVQGNMDDVYVDPAAFVDPFVVLDARHGPISIEAGAKIQPFTRLEGPCHVGRDSQLFRANVREGTTIGPVCRVGGEIEESILHGYANKYHEGFLGHSYVCPWVNLGALTTNSDLKNDYSNVRVPLCGEIVDTGSNKVGCFIGDHTKTALASVFNTGSSIGIFSMVLPGGELLPKHIPSFSRIWHGELDDQADLDNLLATAKIAQGRRNVEFTDAQLKLVKYLFDYTKDERANAMARFHAKRQPLELPDAVSSSKATDVELKVL